MKARAKKRWLCSLYAWAIRNVQTLAAGSKSVATSAFSHAVHSLLLSDSPKLPELVEDDLDVVILKRPRGRPRKDRTEAKENRHTHKIEFDVSSRSQKMDDATIRSIISEFRRHYVINQIPLGPSIERVMKSYNLTHKQAYCLLEREF